MKMNKVMTAKEKKLFVKFWTKEFEATTMFLDLDKEIDFALLVERPTLRLENRKAAWEKKAYAAYEEIEKLTSQGAFPENAPQQCFEELGNHYGYVCDCFHDVWTDYNPMKMSA